MSFENYNINTQVKNDFKSKNTVGIVFLIPIFIIVIIFMIVPLFNTFLRSFTDYNFINPPEYVKLNNYINILFDVIAKISIKNTIMITLFSTTIVVGVSFLFAWLSSKLHKYLRYILCIMFSIVSVTSIVPIGLLRIFQTDMYGFFNNFLLTIGKEFIYYYTNPFFLRLLSILLPSLLGIGPLFLIFTIYFINRGNVKKYFHFAITLQIVISFLSFYSIQTVTGLPSYQYIAHMLNSHIFEYLLIRYEAGYASALLIIMSIILALFITVGNWVVWLIASIKKSINTNKAVVKQTKIIVNENIKFLLSIIIFIFLFCTSIILMYPFLQTFFDSFKPFDELFLFPPKIITTTPILNNYKAVINEFYQYYPFSNYLINSVILIVISTILMMIVSILSSIGLSLLSKKIRKPLLICLTFTFVLSPVLLMFYHNNFNSIISKTFMSFSFGLSIYISSKIFDNYICKYNKISEFITSFKGIVKYLLDVLSLSLIASLSVYLNPLYFPTANNKKTLFHLIQYKGNITNYLNYASLFILSIIIPLVIIIICIPLLINSLTRDYKE